MSWWRRLLLKPPTAEQIMAEMEADGRRLRDAPVAYYRDQAQIWRKHERRLYALVAMALFFAVLINARLLTVFYIVGATWVGTRIEDCRRRRLDAARDAWQAENEQTLQGLADAGLITSPRHMIEIMRDAEPPPGYDRREWQAKHDELLKQWDEQHGG